MKRENMKQEVQIMPTNDPKMGIMYLVKGNLKEMIKYIITSKY